VSDGMQVTTTTTRVWSYIPIEQQVTEEDGNWICMRRGRIESRFNSGYWHPPQEEFSEPRNHEIWVKLRNCEIEPRKSRNTKFVSFLFRQILIVQRGDIGKMAVFVVEIEAVAHDEHIRNFETVVVRLNLNHALLLFRNYSPVIGMDVILDFR
jgi:hypothetical protein